MFNFCINSSAETKRSALPCKSHFQCPKCRVKSIAGFRSDKVIRIAISSLEVSWQYVGLLTICTLLLATGSAKAQTASTDNKFQLSFVSHRAGYNQLLTDDIGDGSRVHAVMGGPLTNIPSLSKSYKLYREPHWTRQSPDGRLFASFIYDKGIPENEYDGVLRPMLFVGDLSGTWGHIVSADLEEEFAWSPDSKQIAYSVVSSSNYRGTLQKRPLTSEVIITGIDGSKFVALLEQPGYWFVLDWSTDGNRLLLSRRTFGAEPKAELFEFQLAEALKSRGQSPSSADWNVNEGPKFLRPLVLRIGPMVCNEARYSPTKSELAITAVDPKNMYAPNLVADDELGRGRMMRLLAKLFVVDLKTGNSRQIAAHEDGIRGPICWTPDGSEVYYSRYLPKGDDREKTAQSKEHGLSIWAVRRDSTNDRFICTGWSPDFPREKTDQLK